VLLDGAHNPHGTGALAKALDELRPQLSAGQPVLLMGVLRDKDVAAMLAPLRASAALADAAIVTTSVPESPRTLSAGELAAGWNRRAVALDDAAADRVRLAVPCRLHPRPAAARPARGLNWTRRPP
jgi:dihydrofolate synthase / folylpolyglutamate synthase